MSVDKANPEAGVASQSAQGGRGLFRYLAVGPPSCGLCVAACHQPSHETANPRRVWVAVSGNNSRV